MEIGTIIAGVATFTGVVLALVVILMAARSRLVQSGDVRILINGDPDKALKTQAGSTLLSTLASNQIYFDHAAAQAPGALVSVNFASFRVGPLFHDVFMSGSTLDSFWTELFVITAYIYAINLLDRRNVLNVWPVTGSAEDDGRLFDPDGATLSAKYGRVYEDMYRRISAYSTPPTNFNSPLFYGPPRQIRMGIRLQY